MTDDEREEGSLVAIAGGTLVDGKATCKCGGRLYRFSPAGIDGQVSCGECKSIWDEWPPCGRDFTHLLCQKYNCGTHVGRWCDLCYGESKSPEGDAHSMAGLSREDDVWLIRCACGWSDSFSTCSEAGAEMDYHLASESGWELCNQPPSSIRPRQPRYDDVYRQGREWLDGLAAQTTPEQRANVASVVQKELIDPLVLAHGHSAEDAPRLTYAQRRGSLLENVHKSLPPDHRSGLLAPDSREDIAAACGVPLKWVPTNHEDLSEEELVSAVEEAREREVAEQRAKGGGCYVVEKSVTLADMTPDAPLQPRRSIVAEKAILIAEALMNGSGVDGEVHQVLLNLLPDLDPFWPRWIVYLQRREAGCPKASSGLLAPEGKV